MKMVVNARGKRPNARWNGLDAIMWDPLGMVRLGAVTIDSTPVKESVRAGRSSTNGAEVPRPARRRSCWWQTPVR